MKVLKLTFLLISMVAFMNNATATVTVSHTGCSSIKATTYSSACNNCYEWDYGIRRYGMDQYKFELEKKIYGNWQPMGTYGNNIPNVDMNISSGTYRVKAWHWASKNGCDPYDHIPIGCEGYYKYDGVSSTIEVGSPTVSAFIVDNSDGTNDKIFCSGAQVKLNGSASYGERAYYITITQINPNTGAPGAWNGSGWVTGKLGTIDLLDVWQNGHSNWAFWPGFTYKVVVAVSQMPCSGWKDIELSFNVVTCKTASVDLAADIEIYPNPATDFLSIKNFNDLEGDISLSIYDLQGKAVRSEQLYSDMLNISDLKAGIYLMQVANENGVITTEKIVVK